MAPSEDASLFADNLIFKTLLDNVHDGVYFVDPKRRIRYWNRSAERITGYAAAEVVGHSCADNILMHVDESGNQLCKGHCPLAATIKDGEQRQARVYLHHKEGHRVPVQVSTAQIRNENGAEVLGGLETFYDATAMMAALEDIDDLRSQALICPLTGVGNRKYAEQILEQKVEEMKRLHYALAVIFIDVDHFKTFNDKYGHDVGDVVLKMVARTLAGGLRGGDLLARWGGEEFIAILPRLPKPEVGRLAERLRILVENSARDVSKGKLSVTVSAGAYTLRLDDTPKTAIANADKLMYQSKQQGRNRVTVG